MAQLVEHDLAKVGVAGSNPVVRSMKLYRPDNVRAVFLSLILIAAIQSWPIGQKVCPISGVDSGQRPFFME